MKKVLVVLVMLLSFSAYSSAQSYYTEVVYLKNGSIIRGLIVEQVPNVSLKIKTADGSIFAYQMADVEKITKEEDTRATAANSYRANNQTKKQARNTLRGYKGFVDVGYIFGVGDFGEEKFEVSTSHGYQFNNYFFLGGGMALNCFTELSSFSVPIFANFRANFINQKVTPFGDFKVGYAAGEIEGAYVSMAVGVRFALAKKKAINLRLEYVAQDNEDAYYFYGGNNNYYYESSAMSGIGLKVGFEF